MKYTLENAEEWARKHPDSFEIPSRDERENLIPGFLAKLLFMGGPQAERMWVAVAKKAEDGTYEGKLESDALYARHYPARGDTIVFGPEHIVQIFWTS